MILKSPANRLQTVANINKTRQ